MIHVIEREGDGPHWFIKRACGPPHLASGNAKRQIGERANAIGVGALTACGASQRPIVSLVCGMAGGLTRRVSIS